MLQQLLVDRASDPTATHHSSPTTALPSQQSPLSPALLAPQFPAAVGDGDSLGSEEEDNEDDDATLAAAIVTLRVMEVRVDGCMLDVVKQSCLTD